MASKYDKAIQALKQKRKEIIGDETQKAVELIQKQSVEYQLKDCLNFINNSKELEQINEAIQLLEKNDKKR